MSERDRQRAAVDVGPVDAIPTDRCVPAADGAVVLVRAGDEVRAFENRCLHLGSPLDGGWVRDGVLSCPLHFWRYDAGTGTLVGSTESLRPVPVEVVDGVCFVEAPEPEIPLSFRERQLRHAAEWTRRRKSTGS